MAYAIIRITKHSSNGSLGGMTKHNKREIYVPNANPELTKNNTELFGTGDYVTDVNKIIENSGALYQKNSVKAIEHIITASPEFFQLRNGESQKEGNNRMQKFLENSKDFLQEFYGPHSKIASISLHEDEKTPHLHAFVVPITMGKLKGGREVKRIGAKKFIDGREKLRSLQDLFAEKMKPLGLERGIKKSKAQHTTLKQYYSTINRAKKFSEANKIEVPILTEMPPKLIGREAWLDNQNKLLQHQLNKSIEELNRLMTDKTFLDASERLKVQKLKQTKLKGERALLSLYKDKKEIIEKHNKIVKEYNIKTNQVKGLIGERDNFRKQLKDRLTNLKARERDLKDLVQGKMSQERFNEIKQEFRQSTERQNPKNNMGRGMG